jgi:hypothetical protein
MSSGHGFGLTGDRSSSHQEWCHVDRGPEFDDVRIGRPATGALIDAGFRSLDELPEDLDELSGLHGVGPKAIRLLREARVARPA